MSLQAKRLTSGWSVPCARLFISFSKLSTSRLRLPTSAGTSALPWPCAHTTRTHCKWLVSISPHEISCPPSASSTPTLQAHDRAAMGLHRQHTNKLSLQCRVAVSCCICTELHASYLRLISVAMRLHTTYTGVHVPSCLHCQGSALYTTVRPGMPVASYVWLMMI